LLALVCLLLCLVLALLWLAARCLTTEVEITPEQITYRNLFGQKMFRLYDVKSARLSSIRGETFLTVRAGHTFMLLSTCGFAETDIHSMQMLLHSNCLHASNKIDANLPIAYSTVEKSKVVTALILLLVYGPLLAVLTYAVSQR